MINVRLQIPDHQLDGVPAVEFGAWLMTQRDAGGSVGQLANAAAIDRIFLRAGDVDASESSLRRTAPAETTGRHWMTQKPNG